MGYKRRNAPSVKSPARSTFLYPTDGKTALPRFWDGGELESRGLLIEMDPGYRLEVNLPVSTKLMSNWTRPYELGLEPYRERAESEQFSVQ